MNAAYLSALAALTGSAVGGLAYKAPSGPRRTPIAGQVAAWSSYFVWCPSCPFM